MAQKLDERPGSEYDDDWKPSKTPSDDLENLYNAPSATDEDLPEGHPDHKKDLSPDQLKSAEESAGQPSFYKPSGAEQDQIDNQVGGGYKQEGKKRRQGRFSRRQKVIGGGVAGVLIGGSIGLFSILQGPFQIIHFGQLLQQFHFGNNEEAADGRVGRLIQYARNTPSRSNLGVIGNRLADRYEARLRQAGLEPDFSTPRDNQSRFIQAFTIDTNSDLGQQAVDNLRARGVDVDSFAVGEDGIMRIDLRGSGSTDLSKNTLKAAVDSMNFSKKSSALAKRLLILRAGVDLHPLKNPVRERTQSLQDWYASIREDRAERRRSGVIDPEGTITDNRQVDEDGSTTSDPSPDSQEAAQSGSEVKIDVDTSGVEGSSANIKGKLLGGGAGAIGAICAAKAIGDSSEDMQYANIALPLMRIGTEIVATSSQVMTGRSDYDVNVDELGLVTQDLYDELEGTSWASAKSIQAELGQDPTGPDLPPVASPSNIGDKPAFFDFLDTIPGVGTACSGVGQAVLSIAGGFGNIAADIIVSTVSSATGVDPLGDLAEWIARKLAGEEVDVNASGALLGNYANYGARLAANDSAISMGGRALSGTEVAQLDAERNTFTQNHFKQKSLFAQIFDSGDVNSVVAKAAIQNPDLTKPSSVAAGLAKSPLKFASTLSETVSRLFSKASAQTEESYNYGFPEYGFSQGELDDTRFEDPYANAEVVQPQLELLNQQYGDCFSMTIDPATETLQSGTAKRYDQIDPKCSSSDEMLLRYRFYMIDTITAKAMSCYEGIDESHCTELGFGAAVGSTTSAPIAGDARGQDTSFQTCTVGQDAGIGLTPVESIKIRLCNVEGIIVNVAIERNVDAAVKGARVSGLTLTAASAYRSYESQVDLRREHCGNSHYAIYQKPPDQCDPPTARPGTSLHEWGLAVDFRCNGQTMTRSSSCFTWLENNQGVHGLFNLPSEAWHWSSTGR